MNSSNDMTSHFIYLIQVPTQSQSYSFTLWVLSNTNSIASVFSGIIFSLLILSITVKANIYVNNKAKQKKLLKLKEDNLSYISYIEQTLENLKRQKKLSSETRKTFENIIEESKFLRNSMEELEIEKE